VDSQHPPQGHRGHGGQDLRGLASFREYRGSGVEGARLLDPAALGPVVEVLGVGHCQLVDSGLGHARPDLDETIRLRVRKGPQQHMSDHGVDGGGRTDAEGEGHQDHGGKARHLEKGTDDAAYGDHHAPIIRIRWVDGLPA